MFLFFKGVLATHKINASSPDTDLPTVHGLRVNIYSNQYGRYISFFFMNNLKSHSTFNASLVFVDISWHWVSCMYFVVIYTEIMIKLCPMIPTETGCELHHQQQGDREQEWCSLPGCEAPHHPIRSGRDRTRNRRAPPHCVLCGRSYHKFHRKGKFKSRSHRSVSYWVCGFRWFTWGETLHSLLWMEAMIWCNALPRVLVQPC